MTTSLTDSSCSGFTLRMYPLRNVGVDRRNDILLFSMSSASLLVSRGVG